MISKKIKDLKYRVLFFKQEKKRLLLRFLSVRLLNNSTFSSKQKSIFIYLILKKIQNSKLKCKLKTRLVNRCSISNRGRGNYKLYNFSRFYLREYMQFGILPGYQKAV